MKAITVKAARVNKGYSRKHCAQKLYICRNTYMNYENGVTIPDVDKSKEIARIFGMELDDIIFLCKIKSKRLKGIFINHLFSAIFDTHVPR